MEKIHFENIQQTRLLDDEIAARVEVFMSFRHSFDHEIVGSKSNLPSRENDGMYTGKVYWTPTQTVGFYEFFLFVSSSVH